MDRIEHSERAWRAAEDLAACLTLFLEASADERTMERSRAALALWSRLTESQTLIAV